MISEEASWFLFVASKKWRMEAIKHRLAHGSTVRAFTEKTKTGAIEPEFAKSRRKTCGAPAH
jgi:hypothetical protein